MVIILYQLNRKNTIDDFDSENKQDYFFHFKLLSILSLM